MYRTLQQDEFEGTGFKYDNSLSKLLHKRRKKRIFGSRFKNFYFSTKSVDLKYGHSFLWSKCTQIIKYFGPKLIFFWFYVNLKVASIEAIVFLNASLKMHNFGPKFKDFYFLLLNLHQMFRTFIK